MDSHSNFLRRAVFTQHNSLQIHPSCCMYQQLVPLHCCIILYGMDVPQSVFIHPLKDFWVVSILWLLQIRFYEHLRTGFI